MDNIRQPSGPAARGARFLAVGEDVEGLSITLGAGVAVDVVDPLAAMGLDPATVGIVAVRADGRVRAVWGLAEASEDLRVEADLRAGPYGSLLGDAPGSLRQGRLRAFASPEPGGGWRLLVVDADGERSSHEDAARQARLAEGLKRLGKALSMNQNLGPLCVAAVHEIASAGELAAVLLWRLVPDAGGMELAASVGVNRQGVTALGRLAVEGAPGCAAELVAMLRRPFYVSSVLGHALTGEAEGRFCYLQPGGARVLPLEISGKLLGVLELVGREGDPRFEEDQELHATASEHLALALNGATLYENLERLASHDPLTGLANHRALQDFLHWRIAECDRTGGTLGCIMIDVDHFRDFNEQEGHDAGDEVLRRVAEAMRSSVRPYDLAARYGGEEFTILVPGASAAGVRALAERVRDRIATRGFVMSSGKEGVVTVSAGCAVYPGGGHDAPSLLKAADNALYEAKRAGRNRVEGPDEARGPNPIVLSLRPVLGEAAYATGLARLARHASDLDGVATAVRLSSEQRDTLEALVLAAESWGAVPDALRPAFPVLAPLLDALNRPHFPEAPAPLLARLAQALLAHETPTGVVLRMDPEIVDLVARVRGG